MQHTILVPKSGTKLKAVAARAFGLGTGTITSILAPHIFCLGPILIGSISLGIPSDKATTISYIAGGSALAASLVVGVKALQPSRKPCCIAFGENSKTRLQKGLLMLLPGLALGSVLNTHLERGLSHPAINARTIELMHFQGLPASEILNRLCSPTKNTSPRPAL